MRKFVKSHRGPMTRAEAETYFRNSSSPPSGSRAAWIDALTADSARLATLVAGHDPDAATTAIAVAIARNATSERVLAEALVRCLKTGAPSVRLEAALALGQGNDRRAAPALHTILTERNQPADVRLDAASYLVALRDSGMCQRLRTLDRQLPDPHRRRVMDLVARLGERAGRDILLGGLRADYHGTRAHAATALGAFGERAAVPALVRALSDPYANVRREAALALAQIGDPRAVPALHQAVARKNDPRVPSHSAAGAQEAARKAVVALSLAHP